LPNKKLAFFPIQEEDGIPKGFIFFNWAIIIQAFIYMALSIATLKKYAGLVKNVFSSVDKITLAWLRNITYLVLAVLFIF
jgi:hypothetical protein